MIVFDLRCGQAHVFEAWFGSSADFADQRAKGLLICPICGDSTIEKAAMAPNVPAKSNRGGDIALAASDDTKRKALLAAMAKAQASILESSDWVGKDFAGQARAMHSGETEKRAIHGQATIAEATAMAEEGVPLAPLPLPITPPDALN